MSRPGRIPDPPTGRERLKWLGPGFLWMVSAAGSGELLFTPRVGSLYGYALIWALVLAVAFKWFINREVGRYAVCTGRPVLEGFERLPGPGSWALWLILLPQALVAVATIAGLGSGAATAAILIFPGSVELWSIVLILLATALVLWGRYGGVEKAATAIALALAVAAIAAAVTVFARPTEFLTGFVPTLPEDPDYGEILPWIGFALSGAAGMMWYSYWLSAKGYGAAGGRRAEDESRTRIDPRALGKEDQERLRGWLRQLTLDNTVAVVGTLLIMLAFLVLGTELLRPEGLVPAEEEMADTLGRLLGEVWGPVGYWIMIGGVLIGFWSTVVSDQDGFGRMFANGTRLLVISGRRRRAGEADDGGPREAKSDRDEGQREAHPQVPESETAVGGAEVLEREPGQEVHGSATREVTSISLFGIPLLRRTEVRERMEIEERWPATEPAGAAERGGGDELGAGASPGEVPEEGREQKGREERSHWTREGFLQRAYVIVLVTLLPIGLYLLLGEPVTLLQIAGAIEAAHIPILAGLILYLNHRQLPESLHPSRAVFGATILAALFFAGFAVVYVYQLVGGQA